MKLFLIIIIISLNLFACHQKTNTQQFKIDQGVTNSNFTPDVPNIDFDRENNSNNSSTSTSKPNASSETIEWNGDLSSIADTEIQSIGGDKIKFNQLQNGKRFLVIGLYDSDCPLCIAKAKIFTESKNKSFFQNSDTCQYVGIVQGEPTDNDMKEFALEYGFQFEGSAKDDISRSDFVSQVLDEGFEFPTTIVVDEAGDIVKSFDKDLGPQTAVSYCQ